MKNKLIDLHNHLFEELERLNDEDLKGAELEEEIQRADAISQIATQIIGTGNLALKAIKIKDETGMWGEERKSIKVLELE